MNDAAACSPVSEGGIGTWLVMPYSPTWDVERGLADSSIIRIRTIANWRAPRTITRTAMAFSRS